MAATILLIALFLASAPAYAASQEHPVGVSLAAVRIFIAQPAVARRWLAAADAIPPTATPSVRGEEMAGVDEADVVGLYVVLTGADTSRAATLLKVFQQGDHGLLMRVPESMVAQFEKASVDHGLLARVDKVAAQLRGKPKDPEWVQLSADDILKIVEVCRGSRGQPVFIHFSE